jgi:signal peptidase II
MLLYLLLSAILVAIDQIVKALVVARLVTEFSSVPVIPDFFHITYVRNAGVVFGYGGDTGIPLALVIGVGAVALVIFGILIAKNDYHDRRRWLYSLALSLLVAGALGNLVDRVLQPDHNVVDYLDFRGIWDYVFNFADMCLTVGISLFVFDQFFLDPKRIREDEKNKAAKADAP